MTRDQYKARLAERLMTMYALKQGPTHPSGTDPRATRQSLVVEAYAQAEAFMHYLEQQNVNLHEDA